MAETSNRQQWLGKGWARGIFIDLKAHVELIELLPLQLKSVISENQQVYLTPLLYDCSLIDECFIREPWVQVLICWPCKEDGNFKFGKNPRRIHFPVNIDGAEQYFNAEAISFYQFERQELLKATPLSNVLWPEKGLHQLLNWVAGRYNQPTFPDSWNDRLATKKKLLDRLWKMPEFTNYSSGVYFNIEPFAEIPATQSYSLKVYVAIPLTGKAHREFDKNKTGDILTQRLKTIIDDIEGIQLLQIDTINENQFTKSMERDFQRWQLEHISYKDLNHAPLPAEVDIK